MQVHTYCVEHDLGFAPNPFHGICSLACCAPQLRKHAEEGDLVVGRGSVRAGRPNNLVYWMLIENIIQFEDYDADPAYAAKIPDMSGSTMVRFGDNIYFRDPVTGQFIQRDSFHSNEDGVQSPTDIQTDTGTTTNVLLGRQFTYFGGEGPKIPDQLRAMFPRRNRRCHHSPKKKVIV
ncbi:hypothetical protein K3181_00510 [Qipengyuania sp. YG27]|uniref:Nucleotide modification associated domain-containing protein n=1 Tax=Qipengyuania mesophila TaxID=2867246 RepID=A0ABS7JQK0_9SPHN|nr:hypothetical protein [Qipengyuania mesophila]MBX7499920.1 hypothetical protein [Qipengyuania mesophila]